MTGLQQRARWAIVWSGLDIFFRNGASFAVSVALARLVSPSEFGYAALVGLMTNLAMLLSDFGFSSALIQRQNADDLDASSVFWLALFSASAVSFAVILASSPIGQFLAAPIFDEVVYVVAATVMVSAAGSTHLALLAKRLSFKRLALIGTVATLVGGGVGVWLALRGFGVWALCFQTLAGAVVATLAGWCLCDFRPKATLSRSRLLTLFQFGRNLFYAGALDILYGRLHVLLIGRLYGAAALGIYVRADSVRQLPTTLFTGVVARVALPIFSAAADDPARVKRGLKQALRGSILLNTPSMLGLAVVAPLVVEVLFGPQWLEVVPVLQILCIAGLLWPLHLLNLTALSATGLSRLVLRVELIKKALGLTILVASLPFGLLGIAWGQVVFGVLALFVNLHYVSRRLDYGVVEQMQDCAGAVCAATLMGLGVFIVSKWLTLAPLPALGLLVLAGIVLFVLFCMVLRVAAFREAMVVLNSLVRSSGLFAERGGN